ncbi:MAG: glycosyltransferase family 1 protein [Patescibacteria group bacterium]
MKIGIDITQLNYEGTGVANFTYNLVKNLLETDKQNEYRLFYASLHKLNLPVISEFKKLGAKIYRYPIPHKALQFIWGKNNLLPIDLLMGRVDAILFSDYLRPPTFYKTRGITVIHDLIWKLFPEKHNEEIIRFQELKMKKTIENGDTVITDSECTKNDLLKLYPEIKEKDVYVIYPGIGEQFRLNIKDLRFKMILKKYGIEADSKFLLYVGAIEPRKNLTTAIEVFGDLIKDNKFSDFNFVIAGKAGWEKNEVFQSIKRLKLEDKVKFTGFVADKDLPYLYNTASLTVYLSSYEGFGLPPLESLACETKVIVGDNSSLKETVNKEFLVDINDKNKIMEKMKYLLNNKIEINAKEVQDRFDWKETAKKFLEIISSRTF